MRSGVKCCQICFLRWKDSMRMPLLFLMLMVLVSGQSLDIIRYEATRGYCCTAWLAPYILSSPIIMMAVALLVVAMFSELPGENYPALQFILIRSGRRSWLLGSILYAFSTSEILAMLICIIPMIIGRLDYSATLRSSVYSRLEGLSVLEAEIVAFLALWLIFFWIGLLIICLNLCFRGKIGIMVSCFLCFFSYLIGIFPPFRGSQYFSPVSWLNVSSWNWGQSVSIFPSPLYILAFLFITGLLLVVAAFIRLRGGELREGVHR